MKRWWVLVTVVIMVVGCGFVVVDKESEEVDHEALASSVQALNPTKSSSYGISTPKTNEVKPMVYHAPWGKSYLFFIRYLSASPYLYAVEMLPDGEFGGMKMITLLAAEHYAVFDGESNQTRVALIQMGHYIYRLQNDLLIVNVTTFSSFLSCLSVWNGSRWEVWPVFYDSDEQEWNRVRFIWTNGGWWDSVWEPILTSTELEEFLSAPLGGVGVISPGETNFMLLGKTYEGGKTVFQRLLLSLRGGQVSWQTNLVYQGISGVSYPCVDAINGYQVYFSMDEGIAGTNVSDLYRFRYLTWDRMIPRDLRMKLP